MDPAYESQDLTLRQRVVIGGISVMVIAGIAALIYGAPSSGSAGPSPLATLNAVLNFSAGSSLVVGYWLIRRRRIVAHRNAMLVALGFSAAFLVSYLVHHAQVGSVPYTGGGVVRTLYFSILIPHIVLATALVPLVIVTVLRAYTRAFARHKRIARVTLPIWLYVSLSGVIVYLMLYH
jgi:uncharacterized membrane protein YozB (DUF420 family)